VWCLGDNALLNKSDGLMQEEREASTLSRWAVFGNEQSLKEGKQNSLVPRKRRKFRPQDVTWERDCRGERVDSVKARGYVEETEVVGCRKKDPKKFLSQKKGDCQ